MTEARSWRQVGLPFLMLRLSGQAGEFGAFVLLARRLAADDFGRLAIAFLIARYAGLVADWGASVRGARDIARGDEPRAIDALIRRRTCASAVLAVGFAAASLAFAGGQFALLAFVVASRGLNRDWLSLGRERGHASGAGSTAQGLALLILAAVTRSPTQAAATLAAGYVVGLAVSLALNPRHTVAHEGTVRVDGWILGSVLADQVTISADTIILGWLRSASAAGIYAAVYRIPNAWMTVIGLTVLGVLPATARMVAGGTRDDARALQRRALRAGAIAAATILASAIPVVMLVPFAFGVEYAAGQLPLAILMVATAVMAIAASMHPLYLAVAKDREVFTLSLAGAVTNVAANAIAIPTWGMLGAAGATLATQVALLITIMTRLRRQLR